MRQTVPPADAGRRLDQWLSEREPSATRSQVRRWIEDGLVTVNGASVKAGTALKTGAVIDWERPTPRNVTGGPAAESLDFGLLYEDDAIVVVDKPPGMVVHPAAGAWTGTLVAALKGRGLTLATLGGPQRPGIVHRLDKDTSGCMVVARTDQAYEALTRAVAARQVHRQYRALVWGDIATPSGTMEGAIARSRADRKKMTVSRKGGRPARTHWRVLARHRLVTDLELTLETGRTHQIRVHCRHDGHPVFGDPTYGGRARGGSLSPSDRQRTSDWLALIDRQALHAACLEFDHPVNGERMSFTAPLPADMSRLFDRVAADAGGG
ncbi:MAG TPA: RluA family pseudouridine synthase [Candidatus Eisenbacteria bacterium]